MRTGGLGTSSPSSKVPSHLHSWVNAIVFCLYPIPLLPWINAIMFGPLDHLSNNSYSSNNLKLIQQYILILIVTYMSWPDRSRGPLVVGIG